VAGLLVRTWNVAHGRTSPETRTTYLEEMVRLVGKDTPALVCLQELPVWSLKHLEHWSGMRAVGARTMPALGGRLARRLTTLDPTLLRSGLTGQANAVLLGAAAEPIRGAAATVLNPRSFRDPEAARLGLPSRMRRAWGANRRVAQAVRASDGASSIVVVNLHLTSASDSRVAEAELARALAFAESFARPAEPLLVCGDFNLSRSSSAFLDQLSHEGFSPPASGIDHIMGRGLVPARGPEPWPDRLRQLGDVLLSDHAPVEAEMIRP